MNTIHVNFDIKLAILIIVPLLFLGLVLFYKRKRVFSINEKTKTILSLISFTLLSVFVVYDVRSIVMDSQLNISSVIETTAKRAYTFFGLSKFVLYTSLLIVGFKKYGWLRNIMVIGIFVGFKNNIEFNMHKTTIGNIVENMIVILVPTSLVILSNKKFTIYSIVNNFVIVSVLLSAIFVANSISGMNISGLSISSIENQELFFDISARYAVILRIFIWIVAVAAISSAIKFVSWSLMEKRATFFREISSEIKAYRKFANDLNNIKEFEELKFEVEIEQEDKEEIMLINKIVNNDFNSSEVVLSIPKKDLYKTKAMGIRAPGK